MTYKSLTFVKLSIKNCHCYQSTDNISNQASNLTNHIMNLTQLSVPYGILTQKQISVKPKLM